MFGIGDRVRSSQHIYLRDKTINPHTYLSLVYDSYVVIGRLSPEGLENMNILRDIFCDDDDKQTGEKGQVNPVKLVGFPALVSLSAAACAHAWIDPNLAQNLPYYFGGVSAGLAGFALAIWGHSLAKK